MATLFRSSMAVEVDFGAPSAPPSDPLLGGEGQGEGERSSNYSLRNGCLLFSIARTDRRDPDVLRYEKAKTPNSKLQAPEKFQAPKTKWRRWREVWRLKFGASLELGVWCLELRSPAATVTPSAL